MASGARLWHKRTMKAELDLKQASRETLLEIIAELRQWVESLEARLSGGGLGARMLGHRRPPGARSRRSRRRSRAKSVPTTSPGRGWNPPGGWSTPRSPAPNAIPP